MSIKHDYGRNTYNTVQTCTPKPLHQIQNTLIKHEQSPSPTTHDYKDLYKYYTTEKKKATEATAALLDLSAKVNAEVALLRQEYDKKMMYANH